MIPQRPPFINFDPGDYPLESEFDSVEVKQDGWGTCIVSENDRWDLFSATGRNLDSGELESFGRTVLYGEYLFGTQFAKSQPDSYKRIAVFDTSIIYGTDFRCETLSTRRAAIGLFLESLDEELRQKLFLVEQFPVSSALFIWERSVTQLGYEGLIFKNSNSLWGDPVGRMKKLETMDYVCMGFEDSESDTYEGIGVKSVNGGLYVDGELVRVCRAGGLTSELREEFYNNPDGYIGKVFEASGKKLFKSGALRHPNFGSERNPGGWRDDKDPKSCVLPK